VPRLWDRVSAARGLPAPRPDHGPPVRPLVRVHARAAFLHAGRFLLFPAPLDHYFGARHDNVELRGARHPKGVAVIIGGGTGRAPL